MKPWQTIFLVISISLQIWEGKAFSQTSPLRVNTMPSYSVNEREGNVALCEPIIIWGSAFGGTPPYSFTLKVDGVPVTLNDSISDNQAYAYHHYVGSLHQFTLLGLRIVRMEVTDAAGNTGFSESLIKVWDDPIPPIRVAMRVEKALLYLYKTAWKDNNDPKNIYWFCNANLMYDYASTACTVMAYEEAGHLDKNNPYIDPYADLVKKGLHYILTRAPGQLTITNHPDGAHGTPVSDVFQGGGLSGSAGQGKGSFLINYIQKPTYANSLGLMALSMSRANETEAAASIVEDGFFAGWTFLDLMKDALDLLYWGQGDFATRGAWRYYIQQCGEDYDGSTEQWPVLVMKAAKDRWNIQPPVWVLENVSHAYLDFLIQPNGACNYDSVGRANAGKTGGFLIFCSLFPAGMTQAVVDSSVSYIKAKYLWCGPEVCIEGGSLGWAGNFYAMYGIMKGLTTQNIDYLDVPGVGLRDWYKDMVAWLTGQQIYSLPSGFCDMPGFRTLDNNYGQEENGSWRNDGCLGCVAISTAHAILILLRSVTYLPPVAVIDPPLCSSIIIDCDTIPPPVNNCFPIDSSFRLSGMMSYHMGAPNYNIVNYLWAIDPPQGYDWQTATITGPHPLFPGFTTSGKHTICLRVEDDHIPPLYDIECIDIWVCGPFVIPAPIAKAIPDSLMPCYTAQPTVPITLDGSESYIPPNCEERIYLWDYNGDNHFDTAVNGSPYLTVTYNQIGNLEVGLIVLCIHNGDTVMSCSDYACLWVSSNDLFVESVSSPCVRRGQDSVTLHFSFGNHTLSENIFNNVLVRLYQGNPTTSGVYFGYSTIINAFLPGTYEDWTVTIPYSPSMDSVWVWIDPHNEIPEWNESNNLGMASLALYGYNDTIFILEDQDTLINVVTNDFPDNFSYSYLVGLAAFPANGFAFPTGSDGNPMYYQPNLNFNGVDSLLYLLRIFNLNGNLHCDDTIKVIIYVIPVDDPPYLDLPDISMCQNDTTIIQLTDYQVYHDPDNPITQVTFSAGFLTLSPDTSQVHISFPPQGIQLSSDFMDNVSRTFQVLITATDDGGEATTDTITLTLHPTPWVKIPDTSFCKGYVVVLNAGNPGAVFHWSNGQSTQNMPVAEQGTYSVTVTNSFGCSAVDQSVISERPSPQVVLTPGGSFVCSGDPVTITAQSLVQPSQTTYFWTPGNFTGDSVTVNPLSSSWYYVLSTLQGCHSYDSTFIEVRNGPSIYFNQDLFTICPGDSMVVQVFADASCVSPSYIWSNGYTANPMFFYPAATGYYSVTVTCESGCSKVDSVEVQFGLHPSIDPISPKAICYGDTLHFTADVTPPGLANLCLYEWSNGDVGRTLEVSPVYLTSYVLTASYMCCKDVAELTVNVLPVPYVWLPDYYWLEPGESIRLDAGPNMSKYLWSTNWTERFLEVVDTGKYWVEVFNNLCANSDTTYVYHYPIVFVPNAFTPNGDGTNDIFYAYCAETIQYHMWLFNRWGEIIFESVDINEGWDGNYEKSAAPVDVYTWVVEYVYTTPGPYYLQKEGVKRGMVVLIR
ncbi:MAG: gliding motility-associated C-terminal domain-containing protein [Bacteroidetes bacterium]|nr:gliding motility-associated C-terminal domain-containing protein [Bacteroidota bacterium]